MKSKPERTAMSVEERLVATELGRVYIPSGTFAKRFVESVSAIANSQQVEGLTDKQRDALWLVAWKFRRQLSPVALAKIPSTYRKES